MAVTGVVLAGGQARRMGGVDKGLQLFRGRTLVESVLERLQPQVSEILINANQNMEEYATFGFQVVSDIVSGYAGPLAGLHSALSKASNDLVLTVPCDSPFLPLNIVERLDQARRIANADVTVARTGEQVHPVFCLAKTSLLAHLSNFLDAGGRKIDTWYANLKVMEVDFADQRDGFVNFNTHADLLAADQDE